MQGRHIAWMPGWSIGPLQITVGTLARGTSACGGRECTYGPIVSIVLRRLGLCLHRDTYYTRCLRKICAKLFLSELCQISINFNNFWQVDGKVAEILWSIYIFHLTSLMLSHYLVKHKSTKFYNQERLPKILSELCRISINLITFGRYMTK